MGRWPPRLARGSRRRVDLSPACPVGRPHHGAGLFLKRAKGREGPRSQSGGTETAWLVPRPPPQAWPELPECHPHRMASHRPRRSSTTKPASQHPLEGPARRAAPGRCTRGVLASEGGESKRVDLPEYGLSPGPASPPRSLPSEVPKHNPQPSPHLGHHLQAAPSQELKGRPRLPSWSPGVGASSSYESFHAPSHAPHSALAPKSQPTPKGRNLLLQGAPKKGPPARK